MENLNPNQWSEVKKIKFHHRVKRFYHKDLFRKIYTVAIIGLIGANVFSLVKYYSVADELEMLDDTQPVVQDTSENDAEGEDENLLTDIDNDLQSGDMDDVFSGDTEDILSGDIEQILTGDVLSGDVEDTLTGDILEDSSLHSEGQDDVQEPHPTPLQTPSKSSPDRDDLGDFQSPGEGSSDEIGTGEVDSETPMDSSSSSESQAQSESQTLTKAQELQKAWETLNTGHIGGSSTYNGLRVSVNAPEGAFPQGTKLVIKPIDKGSKESVSFDISFIYTYSDGSTIELQPLKGKSVQVIFNYDENIEWKNAVSKGQELKVKHKHNGDTEDVKFSNNGEGNLMIDTDKFSEYEFSLVKPTDIQTFSLEDTTTWVENTDFYPLDITGADGSVLFTIMDRNLGAEAYMNEDGKTASQWYGKYYQWGNNYGFSNTGDITIDGSLVDTTGYGPDNYYSSSTFITAYSDWSLVNNKNLWGGSGDSVSNRGPGTDEDRQGPCPSGYHVPDILEWKAATKTWCKEKMGQADGQCNNGDNFRDDLLLPFAGYRDRYGAGVYGQGSYGYYWSSSPYPSNSSISYYLDFSSSHMYADSYGSRAYGYSVRCFKNTTGKTITYVLNNGTNNPSNPDSTVRRWEEGTPLLSGTRAGYTFKGWYTNSDFTGDAVITNAITDNSNSNTITLYAKWQDNRCAENQEYNEELDICYESDSSNGVEVFYGVDMNSGHKYNNNPIGTITVKIDEGPYSGDSITIMDMNLGATTSGTTCFTLTETDCGDVYQRGNNIGLIDATNTNVQEDYKNYRPGHRYGNTGFIIEGSIDYWKNVTINGENKQFFDALWGGLGDSSENNRGGIYNGSTRQGPCPSGYHVPSIGEWNALVKYRYNKKTGEQKSYDTLNGLYSTGFKEVFLLPDPPHRDTSSTFREYYYWSSSPYESTPYKSYRFRMPATVVDTNDYGDRINGYAIRCFKDSPKTPETLTLTFNANSGTLLGATSGTLNQLVASGHLAQQPVDPIKDNATFSKWTTDPEGISSAFDFSSHITLSNTLYAQYTCNSGYTEINGECVAQQFTVTFNANGGEITTSSVQVASGTPLDLTQYTATKTDYEFIGWNTNSGATTKIGDSYEVNGDVTLYAIFKKTPRAWTIESGDFIALDITGIDGSVLFTIMDRNLGAETPGTGTNSYGYYYQRGNNYGFERANGYILTNTSEIQVDTTEYGPDNYYNSSIFIKGNENWSSVNNGNLWGGENTSNPDSRRQGPCPSGYHIPDTLEWQAAVALWCTKKRGGASATACGSQGSQLQSDLLLPFAGYRRYSDSYILLHGLYGHYWSSSPYTNDSIYFYFSSSGMMPAYDDPRADGLSVRCFQNTTGKILIYMLDGGSNDINNPNSTARRWENGTKLLSGTRDGSIFKGWYTTSGFEEGTKVTTNAITDNSDSDTITLYAKWEKTTRAWTIESGDFRALDITGTDGKVLFTIMDRNLGAEAYMNEPGKTASQWYGKYYQWGNNYGFPNTGSVTTNGNRVDITAGHYGPNNYYSSSTFIKRSTSPYSWDIDTSNDTYTQYGNLNLWGGENTSNPDSRRQGPCPSGYHVPDSLEWKAAVTVWCTKKRGGANDTACNSQGTQLQTDLLLPFAGRRYYYNANINYQGIYGSYRSSSPNSSNFNNYSYGFDLDSSGIGPQDNYYRVYGFPVRCFKNTTGKTIIYVLNSGNNNPSNPTTSVRRWEDGITLLNGTRDGYTFIGWYTTPGFEEGTRVTTNAIIDNLNSDTITLYAKWGKNPRDWTIESGDFRVLDVTGTDGKVLFTIMDRNLGAIQAGTGENSYGYFYQRGNNYGFANIGSVTTSGSQVDTSGYGPDNYYSSSTFITGHSDWSSVNNENLWGGEKVYNSDVDRQGPCPDGYHVPDMFEWKAAREIWCREKMGQTNGQCNNGGKFRDDLLLPFAGYRGIYDASIYNQGSNGYYWSSSPHTSYADCSYYLYFNSSQININLNSYTNHANGSSVRCFKNSQSTQTLTFDADNGEDNVVYNIRRWEPITKSHKFTPEKKGYKFVGWYEGNTEFNFSDTTFIAKDTILKAKWEKTPWYTYNSNGGEFNSGNSIVVVKSDGNLTLDITNKQNRYEVYDNVIKFTGANGIHFEGTFSPSCSNTINFYKYDRTKTDEGEIMPSPLNWQYMTFNFDLEGDTLTIETLGGNVGSIQNCPALLYDGTATIIGYIIKNLEEIPSRTGYAFSGWYETGDNRPFNFTGTEVTQDRTFYAKWNPNHYTIQLDINEGTGEVSDINATYGEEITLPIVTREGYTFKGWQSEDGLLYSDVIPEGTPLTTQDGAIVILTAQWESDQEPSNNNYSGGGRKNSSSDSDSETHGSADEKDSVEKSEDLSLDENTSSKNGSPKLQELDMKKYDNNYPEKQNQAYQFAYKNGITTQSTIKSARMNTELTRIQMAKMLSNYAINIMGQEPDLSKGMIKFNDVPSKLDLQYDNAVTKAYQLGIMGQNMKNNEFRPNDKVTRAEFATALSRLLYKTEEGKYKGTGKYYEPHIAKLYNEGIISKTDPSIKEKRGYVMTMLMRTVK